MQLNKLLMILALSLSAFSVQATPGGRWGDYADQEIQALQAQLSQLQGQQYAIQNDVDRLQRDSDYARSAAANDARELQRAQSNLAQIQRDISMLQNRIPQLQAQIRNDTAKKEQDIRNAQAQIAQINRDIPTLQAQARQAAADAAAFKAQINPAKLAQDQAAIRQKQADIKTKNDRLVIVNQELAKYTACHQNECLPYVTLYTKEKAKLTAEIAQLNKDISALNAEIVQLSNADKNYQAKLQQQKNLEAQVAQKQKALVMAQSQLREAQNRVVQGQAELNQAQIQLAGSQRALPGAQNDYSRASAQANVSQRRADEADANLRYRYQDLQNIQRQVGDVQAKISDLQSRPFAQHLVLVGNKLTTMMSQELNLARVSVVNVDVPGIDLNRIQNSQGAVYIMADSLSVGLSADLAFAVQSLISNGGLVVLVGNPDLVTKAAGSEQLQQIIGVRTAATGVSQNVDGRGVLLGFQLAGSYRAYSLNTLTGDTFVEQSLVDNAGQTIGASAAVQSSVGYTGRVVTVGLDLTASTLQVLAGVEQAYCRNISQAELQTRAICN